MKKCPANGDFDALWQKSFEIRIFTSYEDYASLYAAVSRFVYTAVCRARFDALPLLGSAGM